MSDYIYTNFSDNGNNFYQGPPPKKSSGKIAIISVICVLSILLSGFLGVLIGVAFAPESGTPSVESGTVLSYLYEAPTIQNTGNVFDPEILQNGGYLTVAQTAAYASPTVVEITTEYVVQSYYNYITGGAG